MTASDTIFLKHCWADDLHAYPAFWEGFLDSCRNPSVGSPLIPKSVTDEQVLNNWLGITSVAENFYVSHDMMRLAIGAAEALGDDVEVQRPSMPADNGFIVLGSPFRIWDIRGRMLVVNAALWGVRGNKVTVILLVDKYDPVEQQAQKALGNTDMTNVPRLSPYHITEFEFGKPLPMTLSLQGAKPVPPEVQVHVAEKDGAVAWMADDDGFTAEGMMPVNRPDQFVKFLTVVWRLMRQTLVAVDREEALDKRSRRLALKHLRGQREVTIIRLRRREYHGHGDREWSLDHRVLVRGHWRTQWYGSGESKWSDRIFIHPYIKGPEGAPLIVRDHVNALLQ